MRPKLREQSFRALQHLRLRAFDVDFDQIRNRIPPQEIVEGDAWDINGATVIRDHFLAVFAGHPECASVHLNSLNVRISVATVGAGWLQRDRAGFGKDRVPYQLNL